MRQQTFQINGRIIEELLGTPPKNIGEPLWVSSNVILMECAIQTWKALLKKDVITTMPPWPGKDEAVEVKGYW